VFIVAKYEPVTTSTSSNDADPESVVRNVMRTIVAVTKPSCHVPCTRKCASALLAKFATIGGKDLANQAAERDWYESNKREGKRSTRARTPHKLRNHPSSALILGYTT
jgi:hypothetical protein